LSAGAWSHAPVPPRASPTTPTLSQRRLSSASRAWWRLGTIGRGLRLGRTLIGRILIPVTLSHNQLRDWNEQGTGTPELLDADRKESYSSTNVVSRDPPICGGGEQRESQQAKKTIWKWLVFEERGKKEKVQKEKGRKEALKKEEANKAEAKNQDKQDKVDQRNRLIAAKAPRFSKAEKVSACGVRRLRMTRRMSGKSKRWRKGRSSWLRRSSRSWNHPPTEYQGL